MNQIQHRSHQVPEATTSSDDETCPLYFENQNLCAQYTWTAGPKMHEEAKMDLVFWQKTDLQKWAIKLNHRLHLMVWMPDMGHGGSPIKLNFDENTNTYNATNIHFFMPGLWELHFQIKHDSHILDQQKIELEF